MNRFFATIVALMVIFASIGPVLAQANNCSSLQRKIRAYERNSDFRDGRENDSIAQSSLKEIKKWESHFVRSGCQKVLNAGGKLNRDCRAIARNILKFRGNYSSAVAKVKKGSQVAAAREAALQQYARYSCSSRSTTTITSSKPERKTLFERLFGGGDDRINDGDFYDFNVTTYRSVCARSCDGYYWPVSFSTSKDNLHNDAGSCEALAGDGATELYYYNNDSGSPDSMVNLSGQKYADTPNAFRYRREYDASCSIKQEVVYGVIEATAAGDFSKAIISFGDISFPMPRRDPRHVVELKVAEVSYVPLPRPRPDREGKNKAGNSIAQFDKSQRVVIVGEKRVRIVGPDTPYVPEEAKGS